MAVWWVLSCVVNEKANTLKLGVAMERGTGRLKWVDVGGVVGYASSFA